MCKVCRRNVKPLAYVVHVQALELEKTDLELDKHQENDEMESLKKEQDDLLILLADQDTKIKSYRNRLKELGEKVCIIRLGIRSSYRTGLFSEN